MCVYICLFSRLQPYTINFKWAHWNLKIELVHSDVDGLTVPHHTPHIAHTTPLTLHIPHPSHCTHHIPHIAHTTPLTLHIPYPSHCTHHIPHAANHIAHIKTHVVHTASLTLRTPHPSHYTHHTPHIAHITPLTLHTPHPSHCTCYTPYIPHPSHSGSAALDIWPRKSSGLDQGAHDRILPDLTMSLLYYWNWEDEHIWRPTPCHTEIPGREERYTYVRYELMVT